MNEQILEAIPTTEAEAEALLDQYLEEIRRLNAMMDADDIEIEGLHREQERLKAESDRLRDETRTILSRIGVVLH